MLAAAAAAQSRPGARGAPAAAGAAWLRDPCAAMAQPPRQRPGAWVPLVLLLLAGPATCAASPADDGAGPGGRGPRGRARGDAGADEAVPRHDSSYGTFAGEFYDLRYLSEEGEGLRLGDAGWGWGWGTEGAAGAGPEGRFGKDANGGSSGTAGTGVGSALLRPPPACMRHTKSHQPLPPASCFTGQEREVVSRGLRGEAADRWGSA